MQSYLSVWYRSAGIATENVPLAKRIEAISAFNADGDGVAALTQLFYELPPSDLLFEAKFRTPINKADPNFGMSGSDRELIVLAGATLVDVIERGKRDVSNLATLCLVCGSVQNLRGTPAVREIPELAVARLSERSAQRDQPDSDSAAARLAAALAGKGEPFDALGREFQKLQLQLPVVTEEADMLWWVFGETSRDLNKRWDNMSLEEVSMICAKELADLTKVIPGPVAARAFLDRTIRSGRDSVKSSVSIADAVNKTPKDWRERNYKMPVPNELKGILPISEAIRYSIEAGDADGWRSIFKSSTRIASTAKPEPSKLAYQIFLEHLTARCFAAVKQ
jgi:hypothetical protein